MRIRALRRRTRVPRRVSAASSTALDEPELHFDDDVLVPDIGGWRRARMPEMRIAPFITLAPDWVCETLTPSTMKLDRREKLPVHAREGARRAPGEVDEGAQAPLARH